MCEVDTFVSDWLVREEALEAKRSFIVQAPAGSGKTTLLVQRFLALLSVVREVPEECLAITFTRKAASQMRDRILEALQLANDPAASSDQQKTRDLAKQVVMRDKQMGWNLLENPNRLKIQTIDSFCSTLTQQTPIVSRFGSSPKVVENASDYYRLAAKHLLAAVEKNEPWSGAVKTLLSHLDNNLNLAVGLLAGMLPNRDQWLPYIGHTFNQEEARTALESGLRSVILDQLYTLVLNIPPNVNELLILANYAARQLDWKSLELFSGKWPGCQMKDLLCWQGLADWLLTKEGAWRKTVTQKQGFPPATRASCPEEKLLFQTMKKDMITMLADLEKYPIFLKNLQRTRECPPPSYSDAQWVMVEAFLELLSVLTAELSLVFQEKGEVDFTEITLAALKALGEPEAPTDLALTLDYKIRHILVDEFQDTSFSQFRLLEKLTLGWQPKEDRTLFLVGDPMQSIYRFRQAEVGLFVRCQERGLGDIVLKPLMLTSNFRSDPKIVEWVNRQFQDQFPQQDDINTGAIAYRHSDAASPGEKNAVVRVQNVSIETEGSEIVNLIKAVRLEEPKSSIAILVRSRTHLQAILPCLRQAGIDYQGVELERLSERPIVCDLLALTKALLHLGDRIAWLSLLRTPWGYLGLEDLWLVANHEPSLPLWHTLESYSVIEGLSEVALARLGTIVPILASALLQNQRLPLKSWILETWMALGGHEKLYDHNSLQDAEAFFSILEESKNDFFELGVLEEQIQSLYAKSTLDQPFAVQVMTIHKAKGLEFDTVIVPGVGRRSLGDPNQLLLWSEYIGLVKDSLIVGPIKPVGFEEDPIYTHLRLQEKRKSDNEATRLWYVAATRARQRLYWLTHE